jgi:hypothetical protein
MSRASTESETDVQFVRLNGGWLAYALPCRRFACALASANARLGADVDRYSFIASDLHRLLPAGLPAHNPFQMLPSNSSAALMKALSEVKLFWPSLSVLRS